MNDRTIFAIGETLCLTASEYADKSIEGVVRVLRDMDMQAEATRFMESLFEPVDADLRIGGQPVDVMEHGETIAFLRPVQPEATAYDPRDFTAFLVREGLVEHVGAQFVHLGDYNDNPFTAERLSARQGR